MSENENDSEHRDDIASPADTPAESGGAVSQPETPRGSSTKQSTFGRPAEPQTESGGRAGSGAQGVKVQVTTTHIVGLAMLAVGLLVGYYARPLLAPATSTEQAASAGAEADRAAAEGAAADRGPAEQGAEVQGPAEQGPAESASTEGGDTAAPTPDEDLEARRQAFMEQVVAQVRHYRGDPEAGVTLVEFGDFQ